MSLERKDLRLKLDHDIHAGLSMLAEIEDCDMGKLVEELVIEYVEQRLREANVISERAKRIGICGTLLS